MTSDFAPQSSKASRLVLGMLVLGLLALWPKFGRSDGSRTADDPVPDRSTAKAESSPERRRREREAAFQEFAQLSRLVKPYSFGTQPLEFLPLEDIHWCADFSPDGKRLATASGHWTRGGMVRIWDVATRKVIQSFREPKGTRCVDFSPDGKRLASANFSREGLVYDLDTGEIVLRLKGHQVMLECIAYSPDGKLIATGSNDQTVRLWDAQTGEHLRTIEAHQDRVYFVRFSPDGKTLASASRDDTLKLWNIETGEPIWTAAMGGDCEYAHFSPDGRQIASCSWDQTAKIVDTQTGQIVKTFPDHNSLVFCAEFSIDGKRLATGDGTGSIRIWDVETQKLIVMLQGHSNNIYAATFSPDGKMMASASWDNTARLWDLATGQSEYLQPSPQPGEDPQIALAVACSPDGEVVASAHEDRTLRLWNAKTGHLQAILEGHQDVASSLAFAPDGNTLASGGFDRQILLWDLDQIRKDSNAHVKRHKPTKALTGHSNWIFAIQFSSTGKTLASGGYDKTVRLWDVVEGKEIRQLEGHAAAVRGLAFSPDDEQLVSAGSDHKALVWRVPDGKLLKTIAAHEATVRGVKFSPDGRRLATAGEDKTVKIWDLATGNVLHSLPHPGMVWCLDWSDDGYTLATGGMDELFNNDNTTSPASNLIRLWNPESGRLLDSLKAHNDAITSLAFTKNGSALVSGSYDKTVKLWRAKVVGVAPLLTLPDPTPKQKGHACRVGFTSDQLVLLEGEEAISWSLKTGARLPKKQKPSKELLARLREINEKPSGEKRLKLKGAELEVAFGIGNVLELSNGTRITLTTLNNVTDIAELGETGIVAIADDKGAMVLRDLVKPRWVAKYADHPVGVSGLAATPDGSLLATVDQNGAVRLWPTQLKAMTDWTRVWGPAWQSKKAVRFNTNRDHLRIDELAYDDEHPLTLEAIVDCTQIKFGVIVGDLGEDGIGLRVLNGKWAFSVKQESGFKNALSDEAIQLEKPVHLAGVFDGKRVRLFVNGKLQKQQPKFDGFYQPSSGPWMVGASLSRNSQITGAFRGRVQALRISRTARHQKDYEPPATLTPDADTLLLYNFTEGMGERIYDSSGQNHHGRLEPSRWVKGLTSE